jgi:hypothetical protein
VGRFWGGVCPCCYHAWHHSTSGIWFTDRTVRPHSGRSLTRQHASETAARSDHFVALLGRGWRGGPLGVRVGAHRLVKCGCFFGGPRDLQKAAALVRKVSATFSRRDYLRPYMDRIEAMISNSGPSDVPAEPLQHVFDRPAEA